MTLFILMMIKKDTQSVGGVDVSIDDIVGINNSIDDGTNDIIMIDAMINVITEVKVGGMEGKGGAKVEIEDFVKFVLPIFKQENQENEENDKVVQNGTKKIDDKVKNENKLKLINGPAKGFINGLLIHEDMKTIIPELKSLVKK